MRLPLVLAVALLSSLALGASGVEATLVKEGVPKAKADALILQMLGDLYNRGNEPPRPRLVAFSVEGWPSVPAAWRPKTLAENSAGGLLRMGLHHARKAGALIVVSGAATDGRGHGARYDYVLKVRQGRWEVASVTQTGRS